MSDDLKVERDSSWRECWGSKRELWQNLPPLRVPICGGTCPSPWWLSSASQRYHDHRLPWLKMWPSSGPFLVHRTRSSRPFQLFSKSRRRYLCTPPSSQYPIRSARFRASGQLIEAEKGSWHIISQTLGAGLCSNSRQRKEAGQLDPKPWEKDWSATRSRQGTLAN